MKMDFYVCVWESMRVCVFIEIESSGALSTTVVSSLFSFLFILTTIYLSIFCVVSVIRSRLITECILVLGARDLVTVSLVSLAIPTS